MVLALTVISLVYMLLTATHTVIAFARSDRQGRFSLMKSYKKGKFAAIFLAALPLYLAAHLDAGTSVMKAVFASFEDTVKVVALSFDYALLSEVAKKELLFHIAIALCALLAVANAAMLSLSLLFRRGYNQRRLRAIRRTDREALVLVGLGRRGESVLSSLPEGRREVLILAHHPEESLKERAYLLRAGILDFDPDEDIAALLAERVGGYGRRRVQVMLLDGDEHKNLKLAHDFARAAGRENGQIRAEGEEKTGLDVYYFSDEDREMVFDHLERASRGTVHCLNRYRMLARDFTLTYPLTRFVPHLIDERRAAFLAGSDLRLILVGFGRVNRQLWRTYLPNSCYPVLSGDTTELLPIHCTVLDRRDADREGEVHETALRYHDWLSTERDFSDYYPLPPEHGLPSILQVDATDRAFTAALTGALGRGEMAFNMIVVALGDDTTALDLSRRILRTLKEQGAAGNSRIFVRIRDGALGVGEDGKVIPFGDEASLFRYDRITAPLTEGMALDRHLCYSLQGVENHAEGRQRAMRKWVMEWDRVQRDSNVFAVLALRTRLHLLGFDYAPKEDPAPDASAEFAAAYGAGNPIAYTGREFFSRREVDYTVPYRVEGSPRTVLGGIEHDRWVAFLLANGFLPASKTEYRTIPKSELYEMRKHINLTTAEGLDRYDRDRATAENPHPDVVLYDYQLMDDAPWLLERAGLKIIRRADETPKGEMA